MELNEKIWKAINGLVTEIPMSAFHVHPENPDSTKSFQTAVESGFTNFTLPAGTIKIYNTIYIRNRAILISGNHNGREEENATIIEYYGTGPLFQLADETAPSFGGTQGFKLRKISLQAKGPKRKNLNNPFAVKSSQGWYVEGTYGIKDWRGGNMLLDEVQFEHFEYGIWGIESDVDRVINTRMFYNKVAIHLENHCDQWLANGLYTFGNDTVVRMNNCTGGRFRDCQFVKEGSPTDYPIEFLGCYSMLMDGAWFESTGSDIITTIPAYVKLDKGNGATECRNIIFRNTTLAIGEKYQKTIAQVKYMLEIIQGVGIVIDEVGGYPNNLKHLVAFSGSSPTSQIRIVDSSRVVGEYSENLGTGNPTIIVERYDYNGRSLSGTTFTKAYMSIAQQLIPANRWTRVRLDSINYDDLFEFDTVNHRWVAKHSGNFRITTYQQTNTQFVGNRVRLGVFMNTPEPDGGVVWAMLDDRTSGAADYGAVNGSIDIKATAGYYYDIRIFSTNPIALPGGGFSNYMCISRI